MKKLSMVLVGIMLVMVLFTPVKATTYYYDSSGQSFNKAWELTSSGYGWLMKYGYNTAWINEDYTHTYHSSRHHVATVTNARGSFSDEDGAGRWAGIEVRHSGSYIEYSISF